MWGSGYPSDDMITDQSIPSVWSFLISRLCHFPSRNFASFTDLCTIRCRINLIFLRIYALNTLYRGWIGTSGEEPWCIQSTSTNYQWATFKKNRNRVFLKYNLKLANAHTQTKLPIIPTHTPNYHCGYSWGKWIWSFHILCIWWRVTVCV